MPLPRLSFVLLIGMLWAPYSRAQAPRLLIKTNAVTEITSTTATVHYWIKSDGIKIEKRGVCFGLQTLPQADDRSAPPNGQKSSYVGEMADLTGLQPRTRYYVRAYAIVNTDTIYGNTIRFKTKKTKG